jgi:galactose-1-phosphate uridylyltransferase
MASQDRIEFERVRTSSRMLSPLEGFAEVESSTELRLDPLTGRVAIIGLNLSGKRTVLYSETDEALLGRLVEASRGACFFCPDKVEQVTPRYPEDLIPGGGRLLNGGSVLFPNLFPLTDYHAVVVLGREHFLRLDEFTPELLAEGLELAMEFVRHITATPDAPLHWAVCCNYLHPGGASIVHPHLQILGSRVPMYIPSLIQDKARHYQRRHGSCYFDDLAMHEEMTGERFLGYRGSVAWLTAFAPRGNNEIQGICAGASDLNQLTKDHIQGLAEGLSRGLRAYHSIKLSTFNFALYSAPIGEDTDSFRVHLSLISRQSVVENYRCDDYFLQKMLGAEILVDSPEQIAELVRGLT